MNLMSKVRNLVVAWRLKATIIRFGESTADYFVNVEY